MSTDVAKADWIRHVLGVAIPPSSQSVGPAAMERPRPLNGLTAAESATPAPAFEPAAADEASAGADQAAAKTAPGWQTARQAWQDANDAVDGQINGLRAKLLERAGAGDDGVEGLAEALADIAENGLNTVTEDHRVKLIASVMSVGDGSTEAIRNFGPKALSQITAFQAFLETSEMIKACDANPFGVPMSIHATLGPSLQQMAAALQAADLS